MAGGMAALGKVIDLCSRVQHLIALKQETKVLVAGNDDVELTVAQWASVKADINAKIADLEGKIKTEVATW